LLTPQGIAGWWFPFKLMSLGFALGFVGEWHAPVLGIYEPLVLWLAVLLVFAAGVGLTVPLSRVLMAAGLVAAALSQTRNAELLAVLTPLLLAAAVSRLMPPVGSPAGAQARK